MEDPVVGVRRQGRPALKDEGRVEGECEGVHPASREVISLRHGVGRGKDEPEVDRLQLWQSPKDFNDASTLAQPRPNDRKFPQSLHSSDRSDRVEEVEIEVKRTDIRDERGKGGGEGREGAHGQFEVDEVKELCRRGKGNGIPGEVEALNVSD